MGKEDGYYGHKRTDILEHIPKDARRVLDVGCGSGVFGDALKKERGPSVEVAGIEIDADAARKAASKLDKVIAGDVEKIALPFPKGYFDVIIYGDILEHLMDPWGLLKKYKDILKTGGHVIASIPNIAHYKILNGLRNKEWRYEKAGLLDETHLRFFTINSIKRMFTEAGYRIVSISNIVRASKTRKRLNKLLLNRIIDSITEQYIVVAQKP